MVLLQSLPKERERTISGASATALGVSGLLKSKSSQGCSCLAWHFQQC
uniref:Ethylene responsive element binding protein n=1 Tax=Oryza sativa TaxID=4530 RepID=O24522_ORYSA|nr:ethylene responsive element binding protein [Oryza sativa]